MTEVRIHGYGGQGTVTLAQLLAQAALYDGSQSQALPFFGVERRGAPVRAVVRIAGETIRVHSQHCVADLVILMNDNLYGAAVEAEVKPDARFVVNAKRAFDCAFPAMVLDAAGIAEANGLGASPAAINVPLYAAACRALGISEAAMLRTLREKWPGSAGNIAAANAAYAVEMSGGK